jgi:hypothetical protein
MRIDHPVRPSVPAPAATAGRMSFITSFWTSLRWLIRECPVANVKCSMIQYGLFDFIALILHFSSGRPEVRGHKVNRRAT